MMHSKSKSHLSLYRLLGLAAIVLLVGGCTETRYVAHLAKKIPLPTDTPKTVGYFKVGNPYNIKDRRYIPKESYNFVETGIASWYGPGFDGKLTANGEVFDENELTAAHRTLQMPSLVRVTNLENGKSLIVRVNDRGPFAHNRVIDLSKRASELLGFRTQGIARVKVEVLGDESRVLAQVAKRGKSTAGYEVAMNRDGRLPASTKQFEAAALQHVTPESVLDGPVILSSRKPVSPNATTHHNAETVYPHQERQNVQFNDVITDYANNDQNKAENKTGVFPRNEVEAMALNDMKEAPKNLVTPVSNVQGHSDAGRFMPDPVVKQMPVTSTKLFVQAGSFTSKDNAQTLKIALRDLGPVDIQSALIQGRTFHRVRIGPYDNVAAADRVMDNLEEKGRYGTIVVVD